MEFWYIKYTVHMHLGKIGSFVHLFIFRHLILVTVGPVEGHFRLYLLWGQVVDVFLGWHGAFRRITRALSLPSRVIRAFSHSILSASKLLAWWFHLQFELEEVFLGHWRPFLVALAVIRVWLDQSRIGIGETKFSILQWKFKSKLIPSIRPFRFGSLFYSRRGVHVGGVHVVLPIFHQLFDLWVDDSWDEKLPGHLLARSREVLWLNHFDVRVRGLGVGVFCIVCHLDMLFFTFLCQ